MTVVRYTYNWEDDSTVGLGASILHHAEAHHAGGDRILSAHGVVHFDAEEGYWVGTFWIGGQFKQVTGCQSKGSAWRWGEANVRRFFEATI